MTIYLGLLGMILGLPTVLYFSGVNKKQRERITLAVGIIVIFLILSLKKETVGSDIIGYKEQYLLCRYIPFDDFSYVYFEKGYLLISKIFAKIGFSFQFFTAVIYAFSCTALYFFIKKYSDNYTISLIVFVCYQYFVFYISGLRQTIATAICMLAFIVLDSDKGVKWFNTLMSILIVLLACQIHQSALFFLLVVAIYLIRIKSVIRYLVYLLCLVVCVVGRNYILTFLMSVLNFNTGTTGDTLGGNFVMLSAFALLSMLAVTQKKAYLSKLRDIDYDKKQQMLKFSIFVTDIILAAVALNIVFTGYVLLRGVMYLTIFLIPGLPVMIKSFEKNVVIVSSTVICTLLIGLFIKETLLTNQLNLCPYLFFWQ